MGISRGLKTEPLRPTSPTPPEKTGFARDGPAEGVQCSIMLSKDLLEILVCPACKQPLEYRQSPETLKCTHCHRVYPVKDDIPIMLVDEATIES